MALSRTLQATTIAAALTLALSACGGNDDEDAAGRDRSTPDAPSSSAAPGTGARDTASAEPARPKSRPVQFRRVIEATGIPAAGDEPSPLPEDCSDVPDGQPKADAETIACDDSGIVYRLAPAEVAGGIAEAQAEPPATGSEWVVALRFGPKASTAFARLTGELSGTGKLLAILLDGKVISAPMIQGAVEDGRVQIGGAFTRAEAERIAARLAGR